MNTSQLIVFILLLALGLVSGILVNFNVAGPPARLVFNIRHPVSEARPNANFSILPTESPYKDAKWDKVSEEKNLDGSITHTASRKIIGTDCKHTISVNESEDSKNNCTQKTTKTTDSLICYKPDGSVSYSNITESEAVICSPPGCGQGVTLSSKEKTLEGNPIQQYHGPLRSSSKITHTVMSSGGNTSSSVSGGTTQIGPSDFNGDGLDGDYVSGDDPNAPRSCF